MDPDAKMSRVLGILPGELRNEIRSKMTEESDCDEVIHNIMVELQDFTTGRVLVSEGSKAGVHSLNQNGKHNEVEWERGGNPQGEWNGEEEYVEEGKRTYFDSVKGTSKGEVKAKGGAFIGNCHYCGNAGHRANECNKKTADLKAKGLGRESPGHNGSQKGYKGKGGGFQSRYYKGGGGKAHPKGYGQPQPWGQSTPWGQWQHSKRDGKGHKGIQGLEYQGWPGQWLDHQGWPTSGIPLGSVDTRQNESIIQDPSGQWIPRQPGQPQPVPQPYALWSVEKVREVVSIRKETERSLEWNWKGVVPDKKVATHTQNRFEELTEEGDEGDHYRAHALEGGEIGDSGDSCGRRTLPSPPAKDVTKNCIGRRTVPSPPAEEVKMDWQSRGTAPSPPAFAKGNETDCRCREMVPSPPAKEDAKDYSGQRPVRSQPDMDSFGSPVERSDGGPEKKTAAKATRRWPKNNKTKTSFHELYKLQCSCLPHGSQGANEVQCNCLPLGRECGREFASSRRPTSSISKDHRASSSDQQMRNIDNQIGELLRQKKGVAKEQGEATLSQTSSN
jgi:hypothetical protein